MGWNRRHDEPDDTGGSGSGPGSGPRPKGKSDPPANPPGASSTPFTSAVQARPLPILWGTDKLPPYIIEKLPASGRLAPALIPGEAVNVGTIRSANGNAYKVLKPGTCSSPGPSGSGADPVARANSTTYAQFDVRSANGNAYYVRSQTGATSASPATAPAGPGDDLVDGGVHWAFIQPLPFPIVTDSAGIVWQFLQSMPYSLYTQFFVAALCEGEIVDILTVYWDKERLHTTNGQFIGKGMSFVKGVDAANQTIGTPWDTSGYQHTALVFTDFINGSDSGSSKELPDLAFEVKGPLAPSTFDPNPADMVNDLLTHTRRGAGWAGSKVDSTTVTGSGAASFRTYTDAAGIRYSCLLDSQKSALSILADHMDATLSDAYWSSGVLKIVPLGDASITSPVFGATNYVPANTAQFNLTADDFLDKDRPVQMQRRDDALCFNCFPVEYRDRAAGYATITVEDPDQTDVEKRKALIRGSTISLPMTFPDGKAPLLLSRAQAQRSLNVRNTYTFRLSWKYIGLEPTDIVTLTDSYLGLTLTAVRIVSLRENDDRTITFTAEDYPEGVAAPFTATTYPLTLQQNDGTQENQIITTATLPRQVDDVLFGVKAGVLVAAHVSVGRSNYHNLWPNPTSEIDPPGNISVLDDGTNAEFDFRANVGANPAAFTGVWVRKLTRATAGTTTLTLVVPASPDENYAFRAYGKWVSTGGTPTGSMRVQFLDNTRAAIGGSSTTLSLSTGVTTYTPLWLINSGVAPANTAYVEFSFILTTAAVGTAEIRWDAISAIRPMLTRDFVGGAITNGKLWQVPNSKVRRTTGQSINHNTMTTIVFADSDWDFARIGTNFYNVTNGEWTVPSNSSAIGPDWYAGGKYEVTAHVHMPSTGLDNQHLEMGVFVNGTEIAELGRVTADTDGAFSQGYLTLDPVIGGTTIIAVAEGDVITIRCLQRNLSSAARNIAFNSPSAGIYTWASVRQVLGPQ